MNNENIEHHPADGQRWSDRVGHVSSPLFEGAVVTNCNVWSSVSAIDDPLVLKGASCVILPCHASSGFSGGLSWPCCSHAAHSSLFLQLWRKVTVTEAAPEHKVAGIVVAGMVAAGSGGAGRIIGTGRITGMGTRQRFTQHQLRSSSRPQQRLRSHHRGTIVPIQKAITPMSNLARGLGDRCRPYRQPQCPACRVSGATARCGGPSAREV